MTKKAIAIAVLEVLSSFALFTNKTEYIVTDARRLIAILYDY